MTISAKMVPIDHMSMGQEYFGQPSSTSGALYHRVTTYKQVKVKVKVKVKVRVIFLVAKINGKNR